MLVFVGVDCHTKVRWEKVRCQVGGQSVRDKDEKTSDGDAGEESAEPFETSQHRQVALDISRSILAL
jgi:hypothetical protein